MNDPDETIARPQSPNIAEAETMPPSESAAELVRVLDGYMAALQAREAPDRARLLAEHPGIASQLEACLAGIDFIHRAGSHEGSEPGPAMLGEFRIIREVGRGGMGVVYEAEQTSLRRRVALKVLRFGVVADEEALRRFRVEAETVARLHHTNIVPIFAVGTEHDVSYYAMQFIEGRSLADVQEESRRAGRPIRCDDVARWGLQATESSGDTIPNSEGSKRERCQPANLENAESTKKRGKPTIISSVFHGADARFWIFDFGFWIAD